MITAEELAKKIQSLTAKEIILLMVDSLQNPVTDEIRMHTFGIIHKRRDSVFCYGCAATNSLLSLAEVSREEYIKTGTINFKGFLGGIDFNASAIYRRDISGSTKSLKIIEDFEDAIDSLRLGLIDCYNYGANCSGFSKIEIENENELLPKLSTTDWREHIQDYIDLANNQP